MTLQTIVMIRHAEKPVPGGDVLGVNESGGRDDNDLTVQGWQRAGALAVYFGGTDGPAGHSVRPNRIFAPAATSERPSHRGQSTVLPLSRLLTQAVDTSFEVGQENQLALHLEALPGVTLVCWQHRGLARLVRALLPGAANLPKSWPESRFDVIWRVERSARDAPRTFSQLPQLLLAGDARALIEAG